MIKLIVQEFLFVLDFACVILTLGLYNPKLGKKFTDFVNRNRKF